MTISRQDNSNLHEPSVTAAVSVSGIAKMLRLSRARFYQLMQEGVFPSPVYDIRTKRPYYTDEQQRICLEVRKQNLGINGRPILFYARRKAPFAKNTSQTTRRKTKDKQSSVWDNIIEGLKSLGLEGVTSAQVEAVINSNYPSGSSGIEEGELLRTCYRNLLRKK
jgi:hypothetical protein